MSNGVNIAEAGVRFSPGPQRMSKRGKLPRSGFDSRWVHQIELSRFGREIVSGFRGCAYVFASSGTVWYSEAQSERSAINYYPNHIGMVIQDWTSVVVNSLQQLWVSSIAVLGNIVGALIILVIGLVVAAGLAALVERVVGVVKLDKALVSLGLKEYFERAGLQINSGKFFGRLVYWFLVVVFLLAATDILGFYSLSNFLREALLYIPNVIVAVLIMLATLVMGNFLRNLVKASVKSAQLHSSNLLAAITWWSVILFGFLTALSQLGVAVAIIQALVTGFVAMLAIAGGIAFGLGGKEYATHLISKFRDHVETR